MCGIVGFWSHKTLDENAASLLTAMTDRLTHRGPDAGGTWLDKDSGVGLGHRRLSIIDLSVEGAQPMHSRDGRWVVAFNGEIYNHQVLRDALPSHDFRGHSDTESLVEHIAVFGVEATVQKTNGMFAFAAWDRKERQLWLARDRIGIKPLYYGQWRGRWVFGSELKPLTELPGFQPKLNRDAVTSMLRFNYIPCPATIYDGIFKLPPGHTICLTEGEEAQPKPWWTSWDAAYQAQQDPFTGSEDELVDSLEALLMDAVGLRMASDVPLGAFLSGGLDSSTVVSMMQAQSTRPVQTFSIGFEEAGFNEADHAKEIAHHLGTDHTELYLSSGEARDVIPLIPKYWDEPFSDSSQIPTYLVSKLARQNVTVSLSGDGGDELFCGYNRYTWADRIWSSIRRAPYFSRRVAHKIIEKTPHAVFQAAEMGLDVIPGLPKIHRFADKVPKGAKILSARSADEVYLQLCSHWKHPDRVVLGGKDTIGQFNDPQHRARFPDFVERMMLLDASAYMVDDILTKVDRASMAVSLEARVPLLDHRVFEFAWSVPLSMRMKEGQSKWPIREVLARHVPREMFERPKMGFGIPIGEWLRGPLVDWAENLLDAQRLKEEGVFEPNAVRKAWKAHMSGNFNQHYKLWDILMFQAWLDENRNNVSL
jgi:asparagine synthase (glutamine-hydrolysing)